MENEVRAFYNKYGIREWNRLEESTYNRINFLLHMHFIKLFTERSENPRCRVWCRQI